MRRLTRSGCMSALLVAALAQGCDSGSSVMAADAGRADAGAPNDLGSADAVADAVAVDAGGMTDTGSNIPTCTPRDASTAPDAFEPVSVASAVTKVKNLLTGLAPTDDEVSAVTADPAAMDRLVGQWMATPQYAQKMLHFFVSAFQQDQFSWDDMIFQFVQFPIFGGMKPQIVQAMQESFGRTAMQLVAEGRPFTETMTTTRFMMSPAVMATYAVLDDIQIDDSYNRTDVFQHANPVAVTFQSARPVPIERAIDPTSPDYMTFYDPTLATSAGSGCPVGTVTYPSPAEYQVIASFLFNFVRWTPMGSIPCGSPPVPTSQRYITDADFTSWHMVTVRPPRAGEATTPIFDLPSMRAGHDLVMRIPRVGFFTTPAFFARWTTNDSNLARVLLNQTLIVGLGHAMDLGNTTAATDLRALDALHAVPGSACYSCHIALDPMRQFFRNTYTLYGSVQQDPRQLAMPGQFAFYGATSPPGATITDLGAQLAAHPLFAAAWVQRLCNYATSGLCDDTDPEFRRLVDLFRSSNHSWNTLVQALFASPLVTGLASTRTAASVGRTFPIARQEHLCALLSNRLGVTDICHLDANTNHEVPTLRTLAASWPSGQYSRGTVNPSLASSPSLLMRGGMENMCTGLATYFVDMGGSPYQSSAPDTSIRAIVTQLMGLTGSRVAGPLAILQDHYAHALQQGGSSPATALQSTFVLGCLSPYVAGVGQ